MLINDYCSKYWLEDDIQDCCNNICKNDEKLKDNYNNIINTELNDNRDTITNIRNRNIKNKTIINIESNRNKNNRIYNIQKTNTYITLQQYNNANNNKQKLSNMSSSSRISEFKGTNILLESHSKPKLINLF